ncbi:MAG: TlpA disulfide reductase family protein [Bacteroidota bacterium]
MRYLLFCTLVFLAACQAPTPPVNTITANITGAEADAKLTVKGPGYVEEFELKDGVLEDTLQIDQAGIYTFAINRNRLQSYVEPGQDVRFAGDLNDLASNASFEAPHDKAWTYFKKKKELSGEHLSLGKLYQLEPDTFLQKVMAGVDTLNAFITGADIPKALAAIEKEGVEMTKKRFVYLYPRYANKALVDLPAGFQDPMAGLNLLDEAKYLVNPYYKNLVGTHFSFELSKDTTGKYEDVFMKKIAELPAGNIRNKLLYNDLQYLMGPNERLDEFLAFFKQYSTDEEDIAKMEEKHSALQVLLKGNVSPSFDYENYKGGNSTLADYKGKYVYIDVWATWCGPCRREIPSLKEKEAQYHDANVEFVSISIDEQKAYDKWRKMVEDKELGGSQLIADNAWQSDFVQNYKINGIPRFILVDPEGKIVSADAPRPSSDDFDKVFAELDL